MRSALDKKLPFCKSARISGVSTFYFDPEKASLLEGGESGSERI
jgi:hypothetical protein